MFRRASFPLPWPCSGRPRLYPPTPSPLPDEPSAVFAAFFTRSSVTAKSDSHCPSSAHPQNDARRLSRRSRQLFCRSAPSAPQQIRRRRHAPPLTSVAEASNIIADLARSVDSAFLLSCCLQFLDFPALETLNALWHSLLLGKSELALSGIARSVFSSFLPASTRPRPVTHVNRRTPCRRSLANDLEKADCRVIEMRCPAEFATETNRRLHEHS